MSTETTPVTPSHASTGVFASSTPEAPPAAPPTSPPASGIPEASVPSASEATPSGSTSSQTVEASGTPGAGESMAGTQSVAFQLPEGVPPVVAEFAKAQNLSQAQLDASLKFFGHVHQMNNQAQYNQLRQLGEAHIKNWGENADFNLKLAQRALKQTDTDGSLTKALNETGYGNHPAVLNFLYNLGKIMQEGGFLKSVTNRPPGQQTAAQALFGANHPSVES